MPSRSRRRSPDPQPEHRHVIEDVRVLAALAHPVRVRLLNHLLELGPATATELAPAVGVSPSACSYHLRHLERFGLVERAPDSDAAADGRNRPWRTRYTGYSIDPVAVEADPVRRRAVAAVIGTSVEGNAQLAQHYLRAAGRLPDDWQEAAEFSAYGITVTVEELAALTKGIDGLIRRYLTPTRQVVPDGAEPVHVTLQAFRRLER
jgi:DNA-binding transcriptional ArsR family regulator